MKFSDLAQMGSILQEGITGIPWKLPSSVYKIWWKVKASMSRIREELESMVKGATQVCVPERYYQAAMAYREGNGVEA